MTGGHHAGGAYPVTIGTAHCVSVIVGQVGEDLQQKGRPQGMQDDRPLDEALQGQYTGGQKDNSGRQRQGSKPNGAEPSLESCHGIGCG